MERLEPLLRDLSAGLRQLYGDRLANVVLYGSHARGDARWDSDVDVLIVLEGDLDRSREMERTSRLVSDLSLKHETVISRMFRSRRAMESEPSRFLENVRREGLPF